MQAVKLLLNLFSLHCFILFPISSASTDECAADVLKTWRDKEGTEATMAALEKALRDMGREDISENFKQLAYSSYSKDPVVIMETHHVSSTPIEDSTREPQSPTRRISEYLDSAGNMDVFGGDDDGDSPRMPRTSLSSDKDEVFINAKRSSPEPILEESVVSEEKHRGVDKDGNKDGNEVSKEDTDKLLQDFFGNDKGVLNFLSSEDAPKTVENGADAEETEI